MALSITTRQEAHDLAAFLGGNPHNAREISKLNAFAAFAKGKNLNADAVATWERGYDARNAPGDGAQATAGIGRPWNRSAARRANRARKAAKA
jgi:diaminopimelate epimerase